MVDGYTEALRYELYWHGIAVTAIYPGIVRTPFYDEITGGWMVKVGMKLLMATAMKPESMSKLTVKGIIKKKRMVIPAIMWPVYIFKPISPWTFEIVGRIIAWGLRKEQKTV